MGTELMRSLARAKEEPIGSSVKVIDIDVQGPISGLSSNFPGKIFVHDFND